LEKPGAAERAVEEAAAKLGGLGGKNIRVNCVNPGSNDTGYCFGEEYDAVAKMFPAGRWGTPDDTADLVLFLHSTYAKWITGQVIASDGGVK
jgi:3-oxoacyl-[acyl-carrier protein] reductase